MRTFLASFGSSFVLIDSDAEAVIARETSWTPDQQNAAIDEDLLRLLGENWDGHSALDVTILLDEMTSDPSLHPRYQKAHRAHKAALKALIDQARASFHSEAEGRRRFEAETYSHTVGTPPTTYLRRQLIRKCILTNDVFTEQDGLDLEHCVTSVAYCDLVVLDQNWTRRCREIALPAGQSARVFSVVERDAYPEAIRTWATR
jgi:hypothetical protein